MTTRDHEHPIPSPLPTQPVTLRAMVMLGKRRSMGAVTAAGSTSEVRQVVRTSFGLRTSRQAQQERTLRASCRMWADR